MAICYIRFIEKTREYVYPWRNTKANERQANERQDTNMSQKKKRSKREEFDHVRRFVHFTCRVQRNSHKLATARKRTDRLGNNSRKESCHRDELMSKQCANYSLHANPFSFMCTRTKNDWNDETRSIWRRSVVNWRNNIDATNYDVRTLKMWNRVHLT